MVQLGKVGIGFGSHLGGCLALTSSPHSRHQLQEHVKLLVRELQDCSLKLQSKCDAPHPRHTLILSMCTFV